MSASMLTATEMLGNNTLEAEDIEAAEAELGNIDFGDEMTTEERESAFKTVVEYVENNANTSVSTNLNYDATEVGCDPYGNRMYEETDYVKSLTISTTRPTTALEKILMAVAHVTDMNLKIMEPKTMNFPTQYNLNTR